MIIILNSEKGEFVAEIKDDPVASLLSSPTKVVIWGTRVFVFAGMNSVRVAGKWIPRATYNEASTTFITVVQSQPHIQAIP